MAKKLLLVGSQHGNELLGQDLFDYICCEASELLKHIEYVCANPRAFELGVRFTETDMNRSYNRGGKSYEEARANFILKQVAKAKYDYVLDMHTTTANTEGFFICADLTPSVRDIINASTIQSVVVMPQDIAAHSLIGQTNNAISIEYNKVEASQNATLTLLTELIRNLVNATKNPSRHRRVFHVVSVIENGEDTESETNFGRTRTGYYPILLGEESYTDHQGFKALDVKIMII